MSENDEIRLPPVDKDESAPGVPPAPPVEAEGCLVIFLKVVGILILGIFALGALVFATCFLSLRR